MDECDIAQEFEERDREIALKTALDASHRRDEDALYIDGRRCCLDCEEPISAFRLQVRPNAVRCMYCQKEKERKCQRNPGN